MLLGRAPELSPTPFATSTVHWSSTHNTHFSMRSLSLFRTLSFSLYLRPRLVPRFHHRSLFTHQITSVFSFRAAQPHSNASQASTFVGQFTGNPSASETEGESCEFNFDGEGSVFNFDVGSTGSDLKHPKAPPVEVKELEELPEQWRRTKLAWLCKELPAHKSTTVTRVLNAQRKWMRQEDATYLSVHCLRIRENETGFKVYKWMMQQHWYRFDFALSTKLADYTGKEGKFSKCREIFDDIINQGRVPSESTFHILVVAYLRTPVQGCLEEACMIYNRMIQLGGYQPRLSLHNSLFRALVSKPGRISKHYLKQAEFIFHNLVTSGLEIHKDIYGGLIWLHSYQDAIDRERINELREEIRQAGIKESKEVLVSILRAYSREGDPEEAERIWQRLLVSEGGVPSQAFVYKMEIYSKVGKHMTSLEIFREMQDYLGSTTAIAYHKIIEVLCKAQELEHAEFLMKEFIRSGMKPLIPSFIDLLKMYYDMSLHEKLELAFSECLELCRPNQIIYNIYLGSLVKIGNVEKADEIFNQMRSDGTIGVDAKSCNMILTGYLSSGDNVRAEKIYDLICHKKYDIEASLMERVECILSCSRKDIKKPISLKLSKEQREILVGLLLGGLHMESDEGRKSHMLRFEFNENSERHSVLRRHLYDQYHEWLHPSCKTNDESEDVPYRFSTIMHSYFGFYADQFWPKGQPTIPKLIHRWLSPRALAYWYMYGGHRTSKGDTLLKLRGSREGVVKIVKTLKSKSLDCKLKRKGRIYWIGLLGSNSLWFWKLIEPYVLDDLKDNLKVGGQNLDSSNGETQIINFESGSDSDESVSDYSNNENL